VLFRLVVPIVVHLVHLAPHNTKGTAMAHIYAGQM
jgi:hypothetical protein